MTKLVILLDFFHTFFIFAIMWEDCPHRRKYMKKTYLTPEGRVKDLELEMDFLQSGGLNNPDIGSLDDPADDDPWN